MSIKNGNFLSFIFSILYIGIGVVFSMHFSKQYQTQAKSGLSHWSKSGKFKSFKYKKPDPDIQSFIPSLLV